MKLSPDQVNQIISVVSGLLTILVGALVRHYLPPRDGRPVDQPDPPSDAPRPPTAKNSPREDPAADE